jgi:hypothetical protein
MFQFDPSLLTVQYHQMKSVTTALGGSVTIVDEANSTPEHEEYVRLPIPFAVARKFIKETEFTKYLKPVTICVLRYDGNVINLERDIATNIRDMTSTTEAWVARISTYVDTWLPRVLGDKKWLFDGRYAYSISDELMYQFKNGGPLVTTISTDKKFSFAEVSCIDLYFSNEVIMTSCGIIAEPREVMAFCSDGCLAITPPIWKNVTAIGSSGAMDTNKHEHEDYIDTTTGISVGEDRVPVLIDNLDQHCSLNLNFTLNSAKSISTMFGYDSVEPLQLPEIMLALSTVNIPKLPKHVKATFSIGLLPSHGLCWLMGLLNKSTDLAQYTAVRASIKYLTTKGIFYTKTTNLASVFNDDAFTTPPAINVTEQLALSAN